MRWVKGHAFPYDDDLSDETLCGLLDELSAACVVVRYQVDGDPFLYLPTLAKHQRLEPGKTPTKLPAPPDSGIFSDQSGIFSGSDATRPGVPPTGASSQVSGDAEKIADKSGISADKSEEIVVQHGSCSIPSSSISGVAGDPDGFPEFWTAYPRKDDKAKARVAFVRAAKSTPVAEIVEGARRYARDPGRDPAFTKMPTTWLNAGAWANGPLPVRAAVRGGRYEPRVIPARAGQMAVEE